jgi:hypothetical protein
LTLNDLGNPLQSAYKCGHSTETALLKVQSDILRSIDNGKSVALILLDLSAAFDTVDHSILIDILKFKFGISGTVLKWFSSYLSDRLQSVQIRGTQSDHQALVCGVPQGSVLGPLLFSMYITPLVDVFQRHNISHHFYADDCQMYLEIDSKTTNESLMRSKAMLENCLAEVRVWMANHMLKFNDSKTEFLHLQSKFKKCATFPPLMIGEELISTSNSARNIGFLFDEFMLFDKHIGNTTKQAWFQLHNIGKIRRYITSSAAETLVHAFVTSKLDYCNSLLYGLPSKQLHRLQLVQNAAARIITKRKKREHITPVLKELHWLPINQRIHFKISLLTFKSLNGSGPCYIKDMLQIQNSNHGLRSDTGNNRLLTPRSHSVNFGDRAFYVCAPKLWNSLEKHIKNSESVATFKRKLKTHLFKIAYG